MAALLLLMLLLLLHELSLLPCLTQTRWWVGKNLLSKFSLSLERISHSGSRLKRHSSQVFLATLRHAWVPPPCPKSLSNAHFQSLLWQHGWKQLTTIRALSVVLIWSSTTSNFSRAWVSYCSRKLNLRHGHFVGYFSKFMGWKKKHF